MQSPEWADDYGWPIVHIAISVVVAYVCGPLGAATWVAVFVSFFLEERYG